MVAAAHAKTLAMLTVHAASTTAVLHAPAGHELASDQFVLQLWPGAKAKLPPVDGLSEDEGAEQSASLHVSPTPSLDVSSSEDGFVIRGTGCDAVSLGPDILAVVYSSVLALALLNPEVLRSLSRPATAAREESSL